MEWGVHLPQLDLALSPPADLARVLAVVDAARELGCVAVCANDHFVFSRRWLDGLVLLAAVAEHAAGLDLVTSVALPTLRGPVPYAAAVTALAALTGGRVVAGIGPGSSRADYELVGLPWDERWARFDEVTDRLRSLLGERQACTFGSAPGLAGPPASAQAGQGSVELWLASWGSTAGLLRVSRRGDGWLASAMHTTPSALAAARGRLDAQLRRVGRDPATVGHAVVTMWTFVTEDDAEADRVLRTLAGVLGRDPTLLRDRVCIGSTKHCARLLADYERAGCARVHLWPLGDEVAQLARMVRDVLPRLAG